MGCCDVAPRNSIRVGQQLQARPWWSHGAANGAARVKLEQSSGVALSIVSVGPRSALGSPRGAHDLVRRVQGEISGLPWMPLSAES